MSFIALREKDIIDGCSWVMSNAVQWQTKADSSKQQKDSSENRTVYVIIYLIPPTMIIEVSFTSLTSIDILKSLMQIASFLIYA